jgi:hypothetical protein
MANLVHLIRHRTYVISYNFRITGVYHGVDRDVTTDQLITKKCAIRIRSHMFSDWKCAIDITAWYLSVTGAGVSNHVYLFYGGSRVFEPTSRKQRYIPKITLVPDDRVIQQYCINVDCMVILPETTTVQDNRVIQSYWINVDCRVTRVQDVVHYPRLPDL